MFAKCSAQQKTPSLEARGSECCGGPLPARHYPRALPSAGGATINRRHRKGSGSLELQVLLEVALLQAVTQGGHEAACVGAVDDLVVVGQRQEDHVADSDGLVLILG